MLVAKGHFASDDFESTVLPGMASFMALVDNVRECMAAGHFARNDPVRVATILWAGVHGITSLRITLPDSPASPTTPTPSSTTC